jgi:hypothetical protein
LEWLVFHANESARTTNTEARVPQHGIGESPGRKTAESATRVNRERTHVGGEEQLDERLHGAAWRRD